MAETEQTVEKVDPTKTYTLTYLVKHGMFGGVKQFSTARQHTMQDKLGRNILKAEISGDGAHRTYLIKGANLLVYLKG